MLAPDSRQLAAIHRSLCAFLRRVAAQVVIDAFRLIKPQLLMMGKEPRQTTSNLGHLQKYSDVHWLRW